MHQLVNQFDYIGRFIADLAAAATMSCAALTGIAVGPISAPLKVTTPELGSSGSIKLLNGG
jgi:hypothetical protein